MSMKICERITIWLEEKMKLIVFPRMRWRKMNEPKYKAWPNYENNILYKNYILIIVRYYKEIK